MAALALTLVLLAGVVARIGGAWLYRYSPNADYAVVVQMARHMAEGRQWPVFFYGQPYMGSLEPTVSAALVLLFGPSPFVVSLGTALFGIVLLLAVYRWASELGGRWAGVLAMAAAVIGPTGYFHYMSSPRGGYALGLLLTVMILREGAALAAAARQTGGIGAGRALLLGFLCGLGFWNFWLTLPAVAAAGFLLLCSLRWRAFRLRVWCPGLSGFLVGSSPFWIWNAVHGWKSFASQQSAGGLRQFLKHILLFFTERIPLVLDLRTSPRWQIAGVLSLYGILLAVAVVACWPRRGRRWGLRAWSLLGLTVYSATFVYCYGVASFSVAHTPRYLLPFVPLFAVLAGTAVAQSLAWAAGGARTAVAGERMGIKRLLRWAVAGAVVVSFLGVVALHVAKFSIQPSRASWHVEAGEVADWLLERGADAAVADYVLYGFNWACGERFCFSSPMLERYPPYARRLELAEHPAVIENFRGFDHFLAATGGTSDFDRVGAYRVHLNARPPPRATAPVDWSVVAAIRDDHGEDMTAVLSDQFMSTVATVVPDRHGVAYLDVTFREPTEVCGVRAWISGTEGFAAWSLEGRRSSDSAFEKLSPPHVAEGYFWSGPRFFHGGSEYREEKRFAPVCLETLRIRFHRRHGRRVLRLSELQVLEDAGVASLPDVSAVVETLGSLGVTHLYADRWLANQVSARSGDAIWTSSARLRDREDEEDHRVRIAPGTGILVEPDVENSVRRSLRRLGIEAEEIAVQGLTLFLIPEVDRATADYRGLRFQGKQLVHAHHRAWSIWHEQTGHGSAPDAEPLLDRVDLPLAASYFQGNLALVGLSSWPSECHAGEVFGFEAQWHIEDGFRVPHDIGLFVHFLREGKIVFQMDLPLVFHVSPFDPKYDVECSTYHTVTVPDTIDAGPVTPVLGVYRYGIFGYRVPVTTSLPTMRRRVVVPGTFEVVE